MTERRHTGADDTADRSHTGRRPVSDPRDDIAMGDNDQRGAARENTGRVGANAADEEQATQPSSAPAADRFERSRGIGPAGTPPRA